METPHPAGTSQTCKYYSTLTTRATNISDFHKGRAEGCIYCTVVSTFYGQENVAKTNIDIRATWIPGAEFRLSNLNPYYHWCKGWALYTFDEQLQPWPNFPTKATLVDFNPSSEASFEFLRHKLSDCLANHPKCQVAEPFTPTRLLWLVDESTFQVVELAKSIIVNYIALSYCWGTDQPLKLLSSNKQQLKQGRPIATLPVIFRDAAEIARKLGILYLWIDSLCIMQDSDSD
jgi:Heterokaryon incompatibility protein (HET)